MKAIYKREMFAYFTSPIGYIVLAFALCISGFMFAKINLYTTTTSMVRFMSYLSYVLVLLVPLMTMHLWAEERKNKTDQLLLTTNIPVSSIIMGKYFACITLFAINVSIMVIYPMIMSMYGMVTWPNVLMLYLGYFLMGSALMAVGLFVSTMTESQMVSALVSFAIILFLIISNLLSTKVKVVFVSKILAWFSLFTRFDNFIWGVIDISTIIYYITFSALFVFLSVIFIQKKRWS